MYICQGAYRARAPTCDDSERCVSIPPPLSKRLQRPQRPPGGREEEPGSCETSWRHTNHACAGVKADVIYFNIFVFYNKTHEQAHLVCDVFGVGASWGRGVGKEDPGQAGVSRSEGSV